MSKIVRTIEAFVGETVRIKWRRAISYVGDGAPQREIAYEILEEDHTAPPPDVWRARKETP